LQIVSNKMDENNILGELMGMDPNEDQEQNEDNEEEEEDEQEEQNEDNEEDDVLDGGVADKNLGHKRSAQCPMVLNIECQESFSCAIPSGTTISIGLDKPTRLQLVFERFCNFVNVYKQKSTLQLQTGDVEFLHCSILDPSDTSETAALMKGDIIKVRRNQKKERKTAADWIKQTKESDRTYFQQMRTLLHDLNPSPLKYDVIFHCKGRIKDRQGYKQKVLSTFVRGHSAMIAKRCPWLAQKILKNKEKEDSFHPPQPQQDMNIFAIDVNNNNNNSNNNSNNNNAVPISENDGSFGKPLAEQEQNRRIANVNNNLYDGDDDDSIQPLHRNHNIQNNEQLVPNNINRMANQQGQNLANEVEDDEDEDGVYYSDNVNVSADSVVLDESTRSTSPVLSYVGCNDNDMPVTLSHPPEAVKLLLEYCYTNRVVPLGYKAFLKSFKPIDKCTVGKELRDLAEPVSSVPWANGGFPSISLPVALAGIQLAEEARMPRLSLMCEVAASQLITSASILEALALCEEQFRSTGNRLPHLRKAAMLCHILGHGPRGVDELCSMPSFQRTLNDRRDVVVPSLMMGVMETINDEIGNKNFEHIKSFDELRDSRRETTIHYFTKLDEDDRMDRDSERLKRRKKRPRKVDQRVNPYGLVSNEDSSTFCARMILNDEMDSLSKDTDSAVIEDVFRGGYFLSNRNNTFDFGENKGDDAFKYHHHGVRRKNNGRSSRSSSRNKRRR